jgi:hypothetical protein
MPDEPDGSIGGAALADAATIAAGVGGAAGRAVGVKRCEWMERPWRRRVRERYEAEREGRRESSSRVARQARLCVWGGGGREESSGGD